MRNAATEIVYDLVKKDKSVIALTADNKNEVYDRIRKEYPRQYIDYGIAESNMIASAAGLATCGKIPFLYTISNFMAIRALEFIRNDVCVGSRNVKFLGRSCGLASYSMGLTHQGTEELACLRAMPNMLVITPATPIEAREATKFAYRHNGPVYIRLESFNEPELFDNSYEFDIGKGQLIKSGNDVTVISMGSVISESMQAAKVLEKENIAVRIIDMPMVDPLDESLLNDALNETRMVITLEEHSIYGGLGSAVAEYIAEHGFSTKLIRMGLKGTVIGGGSRLDIREKNHISSGDIVKTVRENL